MCQEKSGNPGEKKKLKEDSRRDEENLRMQKIAGVHF
jgi:hypothetical protein